MMNLRSAFVLSVLSTTALTLEAFAPRPVVSQSRTLAPVSVLQAHNEKQKASTPSSWQHTVSQAVATAFLSATLWSSGGLSDVTSPYSFFSPPPTAVAREMASGSGSRVNKDPESLLRLALPINNKEVRKLQSSLEDIKLNLGSKRKQAALDDIKKARTFLAGKDAAGMKAACRQPDLCGTYLTSIADNLDPLSAAVKTSMESFNGSEQERDALDKAYEYQKKVTNTLTDLEEQMVPAGYKTPVPSDYDDLVQLNGRAVVKMQIVKGPNGSSPTFDVEGQAFKQADMTMVIDGYSAPVTGGNFVDLVQRGFYDKMPVQRADGFVVQTGDPDGEAAGFVGKGGKALGEGPKGERLIPLEIFVKGDKGPFYEYTMEDESKGGYATALPFNAYGAMGWAREEYDANSGSSQFFWLLFDSDLTPAGKNVMDGTYSCFGYVVEGADFLSAVDEGDVIVSAKVVEGAQNLVQPR